VKPGDTVLDVGAGTGILSLMAARAGAARVYAVERTSIAQLARELVTANGAEEIVEVIEEDLADVELPGKVDVIVSEWLGGFGIDEGMLVPVLAARDRWLRPGGVMLPATVVAWVALVHDEYIADSTAFLYDDPYGFDLGPLADKTVNELFYSAGSPRSLAREDLRSEPAQLWTTDAARMPLAAAEGTSEAEAVPRIRHSGSANALALWFTSELAPGIELSIGPGEPLTHWGMTTAPLATPVALEEGSAVRIRFTTTPAGSAGTWSRWAIQVGDGPWEEHDEQAVWAELED
jgi:type I protein arginine methyltransferase